MMFDFRVQSYKKKAIYQEKLKRIYKEFKDFISNKTLENNRKVNRKVSTLSWRTSHVNFVNFTR